MPDDPDEEVGRLATTLARGSIVAAAGCGKTEQITRAVSFSDCRRLILTHTHAGVDAISKRLKFHRVPPDKYRVDTIAGWCLRFASAFPQRSGIAAVVPTSTAEWNADYEAAAQLIKNGALSGVIGASYGGLFVDEYQDCIGHQHNIIQLLAEQLPSCIFGDPLQAIFDFHGQQPVDWNADVFPTFPKVAELTTPWRWKNARNDELAEWLKDVRRALEHGDAIDLTVRPVCLSWVALPADPRFRQARVLKECHEVIDNAGNLIVIGDAANMNARTALAQKLAKRGFSNIEPIACKDLYAAGKAIQKSAGINRFKAILAFVSKCMTGTEKADLESAVLARIEGRKQGQARFGALLPITDAIIQTGSDEATLAFLHAMQERTGTQLFRKEMFFAMRSALQIKSASQVPKPSRCNLGGAEPHPPYGSEIRARSIGSTLLVKGLEFDHAVIVHAANMTRKDWYVALTRATTSIRVVSPTERLTPPD